MNQSFGRRAAAPDASHAAHASLPAMAKFARPPKEEAPVPPAEQLLSSVDEEIREWKKTRGSRFPIQLLTVVAAVSFDIAAIVLPDDISDWLQYPLYALSAASLYVGFVRRKKSQPRN